MVCKETHVKGKTLERGNRLGGMPVAGTEGKRPGGGEGPPRESGGVRHQRSERSGAPRGVQRGRAGGRTREGEHTRRSGSDQSRAAR